MSQPGAGFSPLTSRQYHLPRSLLVYVMHGGEAHPASEDGCRNVPGREEDRRESGDEEAAKEMEEEGE